MGRHSGVRNLEMLFVWGPPSHIFLGHGRTMESHDLIDMSLQHLREIVK